MSRYGTIPVIIPEGVTIETPQGLVVVKGPKGELSKAVPREAIVEISDAKVAVAKKNESKFATSLQGTIKAHIKNMIKGVTEGWKKELEIVGTGYRGEVKGSDLVLAIGYSHPVIIKAPEGITFSVEKTKITVSGIDREVVGQTAALIREVRKPEPYKGKGIKYSDEVVRRKAGKQAAKAGGTA